jgi:predicted DNA-binding transcriptional regulator AlpA
MPEYHSQLPRWLSDRRYCKIKDLMKLFSVSRPTIDRWCRDNPKFPKKRKLGIPGNGNCSTRFVVSEVAAYMDLVDNSALA